MKTKLDRGASIPVRAHGTDAGAGLRPPIDTAVPARGSRAIGTGAHIRLPHGCAGMLKSKSGPHAKHGITSGGVIDGGCTGSIKAKPCNHGDGPCGIGRHGKITQPAILRRDAG